jgi:integrase/recombinase XerC
MTSNWYEEAVKASGLVVLREEEAFFNATLQGWSTQKLSAGLKRSTIEQEAHNVVRFAEFSERFPWQWTPEDLEGYTVHRLSSDDGRRPVAHSTLIGIHGAIRRYCDYVQAHTNDWSKLCLERFGATPNQVCFDWNSRTHTSDHEGDPSVRGFTYEELRTLWAASSEWVAQIRRSGEKGWLSAMRDVTLFKTAWAFGLRRNELRMLDLADFHPNPRAPQWGSFAKISVRYGKSGRGGQPKPRVVFLLPQYSDVIPELSRWIERLRPQTQPGELPALFVTERRTRIGVRSVDTRFALLREFAGLPKTLTMHSFRRSYISHIQEYGLPALFAQYQAGHTHAGTTGIYTSVSDEYRSRVVRRALNDYGRADGNDGSHQLGVERPESDGGSRHV